MHQNIRIFLNKIQENDQAFWKRCMLILGAGNILLFFSLTAINPIALLNPIPLVQYLFSQSKQKLILFYPMTLDDKKDPNHTSTPFSKIQQHVYQIDKEDPISIEQNAQYIIHALMFSKYHVGLKMLTQQPHMIRKIWFHNKQLIIDIRKNPWDDISTENQTIIQKCVEQSILANLHQIENIYWAFYANPEH